MLSSTVVRFFTFNFSLEFWTCSLPQHVYVFLYNLWQLYATIFYINWSGNSLKRLSMTESNHIPHDAARHSLKPHFKGKKSRNMCKMMKSLFFVKIHYKVAALVTFLVWFSLLWFSLTHYSYCHPKLKLTFLIFFSPFFNSIMKCPWVAKQMFWILRISNL